LSLLTEEHRLRLFEESIGADIGDAAGEIIARIKAK
jgi:hypothetical protein